MSLPKEKKNFFKKKEKKDTRYYFRCRLTELNNAFFYKHTLTVNYGVKQSKFIILTLEPRASDPEESNEIFDPVIRR